MADEELVVSSVSSPTATEHHKRKLEDLEAPVPTDSTVQTFSKVVLDLESLSNEGEDEENGGADETEAKRPRLETDIEEPEGVVSQNGLQEDEKNSDTECEEMKQSDTSKGNSHSTLEAAPEPGNETLDTVNEKPDINVDIKLETESAEVLEVSKNEKSSEELLDEENVSTAEVQPVPANQIMTRQLEVPNDKVGVLIGKAGDTIRSLQDNSGAKIQIMKDADADPHSTTRPLELVGTLESITRAEKLIKDVIAEADAGGSPSLVARGFSTVQAAGGGEQLELQVPIEKVGLIIGKGGETIRNLQTRSGARIQLIQQNLPEGNQPKDRTVRVSGNKKQIEIATDMIKDVMNQTLRASAFSSGYGQQGSRPRGSGAPQWGQRGPHHGQFSGYDFPQRVPPYSQNAQHLPAYGNYPPQQGSRSNFGSTWEQRPPPSMRGPSHQGNYNYGPQQGPDYGSYSQAPQSYGHGYNEGQYDHQASSQHYGSMNSQPAPYAQGGPQSGYGPQDQYGKPPMYGMPQQVPYSYGPPRPNQPGTMPHQGNVVSTQSYGQSAPPQQPYMYASTGQMQQNYPSYGSGVTADGYSQPPSASTAYSTQSASGYPSQGGQPAAMYGQPGAQQPAAYPQPGSTGGYGSYPAVQPSYAEQPAVNNTGYGYQGVTADPAYGGGQAQAAAYAQPSQTQPSYDQSGSYGSAPVPTGYGKSASPQAAYQQYDTTQAYAAQR